MALILGFLTYIGWGSGDIFGVIATRKVGAYIATIFVFIFGFIFFSLYVPFAPGDLSKVTPFLLILNVIFGVAVLVGNYMLNEAFKRSNVSLIGIIVQSFPVLVLILSALIFKDELTDKQLLWALIIFSGVAICTVNFRDFRNSHLFADYGVKLCLIATFMFSIYFTFLRIFIDAYGWFWPNYIAFASFPIAIVVIKRVFKIKEKFSIPKSPKILLSTALSAILLRGGDIALNVAIASGFAATATPIATAAVTLFIALSALIFKDPITKQQKIGIGISLAGILLLSFFPK